jgi:NADPH:quinone reductase-like Zn-dependent oxidoreductase
MKAVQFPEHGGREVIEYAEVPTPSPGRKEVLVDVKAAALNHLDVWVRRGMPGLDLEMPHTPGSDAAGIVRETGADVTRFEPGDRVALLAGIADTHDTIAASGDPTLSESFRVIGEHLTGVHAEYMTVPPSALVSVPDDVDWETAAAAPLVFGTAWRMLVSRGDLSAGEEVLVLGASGGVGHAAVQIAAHAGATVFATGSTDAKLAAAKELGADHTIDYEAEPFHREIRQLTDGRGVDLVVDHVGEATWDRSLKSLAKGGRLLTCGATTGPHADTNVNRVFWNQLSIIGSTMCTPAEAERVLELVYEGPLRVEIRDTLPMSETAEGHRMLEDRDGFGKVVVIPDSEL